MQNWLDIVTMRTEETEERIHDIEDKIMENSDTEKKRQRKLLEQKGIFMELSDSVNRNNIHFIRVPEEEKRDKWTQGLFEQIIADNSPKVEKETGIEVQKA